MIIGSFGCSQVLSTLIHVLLLALKYMEVCLFLFAFYFGGSFKAASTTAASLANISGDCTICFSFSMLPVEVSVSTISVCIAEISGFVFPFCFGVPTLAVNSLHLGFFFLLYSPLHSLFPWCLCCCFFLYLRLNNLALSSFFFLSLLCLNVLCSFTICFLTFFSVFSLLTAG